MATGWEGRPVERLAQKFARLAGVAGCCSSGRRWWVGHRFPLNRRCVHRLREPSIWSGTRGTSLGGPRRRPPCAAVCCTTCSEIRSCRLRVKRNRALMNPKGANQRKKCSCSKLFPRWRSAPASGGMVIGPCHDRIGRSPRGLSSRYLSRRWRCRRAAQRRRGDSLTPLRLLILQNSDCSITVVAG